MPLPTCECVNGLPTQQQLGYIYCALLEILAGQGGDITLSQISDLDASWIPPLQAPLGNFSITASQISDSTIAGRNMVTLPEPPADRMFLVTAIGTLTLLDGTGVAMFITNGAVPFTGTVNPVTEVEANTGILTNVS
jgi:hypothetical protein